MTVRDSDRRQTAIKAAKRGTGALGFLAVTVICLASIDGITPVSIAYGVVAVSSLSLGMQLAYNAGYDISCILTGGRDE